MWPNMVLWIQLIVSHLKIMRKLKNLIRSPYLPLQQCINRIIKLQKCSPNESHIDTNNTSENVIDQSDDIQLKILKHNNFTIKLNGKDNCLLLKDKICLVKKCFKSYSEVKLDV